MAEDTKEMTADATAPTVAADTASETPKPAEKKRYAWLCLLSLALCIASWYMATKNGFATLALGVLSIVFGAWSLGSRKGAIRNTAITMIIAAAVLILIVGAFIFALHKLLA